MRTSYLYFSESTNVAGELGLNVQYCDQSGNMISEWYVFASDDPSGFPDFVTVNSNNQLVVDVDSCFLSNDDIGRLQFDVPNLPFITDSGSSRIQPENDIYYDLDALLFSCNLPPIDSNPSSLPSLNGNGCEYLDGESVQVVSSKTGQVDRETIYAVSRSYFSIFADNGYIVHYDLVSDDGHKLTCPEALLRRYVATPTAP